MLKNIKRRAVLYLLLTGLSIVTITNKMISEGLPRVSGPIVGSIGESSETSGFGGPGGSGGAGFTKEPMFTGDVSFPLSLVTIGAIEIQLQYNSNVHKQIRADNEVAPSGWVGLGWNLELGTIIGETSNTTESGDDKYYYVGKDGSSEIIQPEVGKFQIQQYKVWKITRQDSAGIILGWEIIKEDGTILRFGNYDKESEKFSLSYWPTYATRCMLGFRGLVMNPPPRLYDSLSLIPYQWDLSDVEDVAGNHTTVTYQQVQEQLKLDAATTTKYYTRESHAYKIQDNTGGEVRFELCNMASDEYSGDSTSYFQYLFEKKYLNRLELIQNGQAYKKILMDYESWDTLNLGAKKRYLTKIEIQDKWNKSIPMRKFEYCGSTQVNPGALRQVINPSGGKIEYTYKAQELTNVELGMTDRFMDHIYRFAPTYGLSGNDFCAFRHNEIGLARVYRRYPNGWQQDTSHLSILGCQDYLYVASDYTISGYPYPSPSPPFMIVTKRTRTGWRYYWLDSVLTQQGDTVGDRLWILGTGPNYFVIAYHPNWIFEAVGHYKVAVVRFTEKGLSFFKLSERYEGVEYRKDETYIYYQVMRATCGNNFFVITSHKYVDSMRYLIFSYYEYQTEGEVGTWKPLRDKVDDFAYYGFGEGRKEEPYSISIGNNFVACAIGDYGTQKIIYRRTGDSLREEYRQLTGGSSGFQFQQAVAADHYCAFNINREFDLFTWNGSEFTHEVIDSVFGRPNLFSGTPGLTTLGNKLIASYEPVSLPPIPMRIAVAEFSPETGQWSKEKIVEQREYFGHEGHLAMVMNQNTFAVQWIDLNYGFYTSFRVYQFKGDSIDAVTVDSLDYLRSMLEECQTSIYQPGENFIAFCVRPILEAIDTSTGGVHTMANDINGNITFNGHPYDYVLDTMKVIDGMGDTLKTRYLFENGVYDEQINFAKYNKVTVFHPGNNGKTVTYYYNDLDSTSIVDNVPDGEYINAEHSEELDGVPYMIKVFSEENPTTSIQTTANYFSAKGIDDTLGIFYQQLDSTETTQEGVMTRKLFKYNSANLLPRSIVEKVGVTTDQGADQDRLTELTYAFEKPQYSILNSVNMISQVYEEKISSVHNIDTLTVSKKRTDYHVPFRTINVIAEVQDEECRPSVVEKSNSFSVAYTQEVSYIGSYVDHGVFFIGTTLGGNQVLDYSTCGGYTCQGTFTAAVGQVYYLTARAYCQGDIYIYASISVTYDTSAQYIYSLWLPHRSLIFNESVWDTVSTIISRDSCGNVKEAESIDGVRTTTKWGYVNSVPIATIINAADVETKVVVCDTFMTSGYGPLADGLGAYYLGGAPTYSKVTRGFEDLCQKVVAPSSTTGGIGLSTSITSPDAAVEYIIEFDFLVDEGTLEILTGPVNYKSQATYTSTAYKKKWHHAKIRWDLQGNAGNNTVWFRAHWNGATSAAATFYLDNIRIYPADAVCTSQAYDPVTLDVISTTDENGVTRYVTRDSFGRQTAVVK